MNSKSKNNTKQSRRHFIKQGSLAGSLLLLPAFSWSFSDRMDEKVYDSETVDPLFEMGLLDITKPPFNADPTGKLDSTKAIQQAVNEARNRQMICFFPVGTYLISDTISCEQRVEKLEKPRYTDDMRQSWWNLKTDRHYLLGSTKDGKRPVLKLSPEAKGFDDPNNPKLALKIWAQTRNDAPGTHQPKFGSEQPNISFGHIFRGIDFDLSGHSGAIGLRHAGSQGCLLMDSTVYAEGAFAGFNNCPGQGGGTYNIATYGGRYGLLADSNYRFPMLASSTFSGQTVAPIAYFGSSLPMVLVGCYLESNGKSAIDITGINKFPGISMIDSIVKLNKPGTIVAEQEVHNLFMENVFIKGVKQLQDGGEAAKNISEWTKVKRYSSCTDYSENLINGVKSTEPFLEWEEIHKVPDRTVLQEKHWSRLPSFEDDDAVNIKSFGAAGNGDVDDSKALETAMKHSKKIFFPKGSYRIDKNIQLAPGVRLFGVKGATLIAPKLYTFNHAEDDSFFSFISVKGILNWGSGKGTMAFANAPMEFTENGGGRFYALRNRGRNVNEDAGELFEGTRQPIFIYTLNIERRRTNPQAYIRNVKHLRLFYLKSESSPKGFSVEGGKNSGNTPLAIIDSDDVKVYGACGNVLTLDDRPFIDVKNSGKVMISQVKSFKTGSFPQVRELFNGQYNEVPSSKIAALFIRD